MYKRYTSPVCAFPPFLLLVLFLGASFLFVPLARGDNDNIDEKRDPRFTAVDDIFEKAVAEGKIPGAVVLVGHKGEVVYRRAFGSRSLEPRHEPMTLDTIFDLASLTKSIATAPSIMRMVQLGQVRLNDPVVKYLPEFGRN